MFRLVPATNALAVFLVTFFAVNCLLDRLVDEKRIVAVASTALAIGLAGLYLRVQAKRGAPGRRSAGKEAVQADRGQRAEAA